MKMAIKVCISAAQAAAFMTLASAGVIPYSVAIPFFLVIAVLLGLV